MRISKNHGVLVSVEGLDIEIMSHNFHNPTCNIIATYFLDAKGITELTYYRELRSNKEGFEVYKFKSANAGCNHYYSRVYGSINQLPEKYRETGKRLKRIHSGINFEQYKARPPRIS